MLWVALACSVAAAALVLHWRQRPDDAIGRPRSFPHHGVAAAGLLCLVSLVPVWTHHREEVRLTQVATALVGTTAHVHCQTFGQALGDVNTWELGYVEFGDDGVPQHATLIKREQCGYLKRYYGSAGDRAHPSHDEVVAVHVLTHESMHMRGETNEAVTECEAMQRDARTATLLGATHAEALALARTYWRTVYPWMPDDYRTNDCAPGRALDEHLADAPWSP